MNLNYLFKLIFIVTQLPCLGQTGGDFTIVADYDYYRKPETSPFIIQYNSRLTVEKSSSLYEIFLISSDDSSSTIVNSQGSFTMYKEKNNPLYFKDLAHQKMINTERILLKKFVVVDNLNVFEWSITDDQKNILGHKCQKAVTSFRGRDYTAYFALDIPVSNGPWKFHGLPGLILEVSSNDESFKLNARSLTLKNSNEITIENPYSTSKLMTRKDFEVLYKKKYEEVSSYKDDEDTSMKMSKGLIEIIVKE